MMENLLKMMLALTSATVIATETDSEIYTHECTSWMIFSNLTKNNTSILHKNRDAKNRNLMPLKSPEGASRKWIGLGDMGNKKFVCMGMNTSGLAVTVNSGERTPEHSDPQADLGTPAITKICLSQCDTAAQAVKKLEEIRRSRRYSHGKYGSIFFFMDLKEGFIVEMTSERCFAQRYDRGYAFRANIWHNPNMAASADNLFSAWINSCNREFMVISDLNRAWHANKKITIADMLIMSRDTVTPKDSHIKRTLCSKSTNSASSFEIDHVFPDVLSTGYFLIGPPRHTLCVPIPICVEKYHPRMTDFAWSAAAWKSFDANGFNMELPSSWKDFETYSLAEYKSAQMKAADLLKAGKRSQAVKLLNDTAYSIWDEAAKLLRLQPK